MATNIKVTDWEAFLNGETPKSAGINNVNLGGLTSISEIYNRATENNIEITPLDIRAVAEKLFGIKVYDTALDRSISGFIERSTESDWVIHVNQYENPLRKKFTIAHELGHFIMHRDILLAGSHVDQILFRDDQNSAIEMEASEFAANLLMPKEVFAEYIQEGVNTIEELSKKFELSSSAVRYRAYKLRYISEF